MQREGVEDWSGRKRSGGVENEPRRRKEGELTAMHGHARFDGEVAFTRSAPVRHVVFVVFLDLIGIGSIASGTSASVGPSLGLKPLSCGLFIGKGLIKLVVGHAFSVCTPGSCVCHLTVWFCCLLNERFQL